MPSRTRIARCNEQATSDNRIERGECRRNAQAHSNLCEAVLKLMRSKQRKSGDRRSSATPSRLPSLFESGAGRSAVLADIAPAAILGLAAETLIKNLVRSGLDALAEQPRYIPVPRFVSQHPAVLTPSHIRRGLVRVPVRSVAQRAHSSVSSVSDSEPGWSAVLVPWLPGGLPMTC